MWALLLASSSSLGCPIGAPRVFFNSKYLFPSSPHVVFFFQTGNALNMTVCEYNASIHLQVTWCCIVWLLLSCHFFLPPPNVVLPFTLTGNVWNMTASEYIASIPLQVTVRCIVWLLLSCHFSFLPSSSSPLHNWECMEMTVCEYNASIHLQVTLHCIVWLLLSCCFLIHPLILLFSPSQLGMHGT